MKAEELETVPAHRERARESLSSFFS